MVLGLRAAVVPNYLEATDHLTDGEKAKAFRKQNAGSNKLSSADISRLLDDSGGLICNLGCLLK